MKFYVEQRDNYVVKLNHFQASQMILIWHRAIESAIANNFSDVYKDEKDSDAIAGIIANLQSQRQNLAKNLHGA